MTTLVGRSTGQKMGRVPRSSPRTSARPSSAAARAAPGRAGTRTIPRARPGHAPNRWAEISESADDAGSRVGRSKLLPGGEALLVQAFHASLEHELAVERLVPSHHDDRIGLSS